MIIYSSQIQGLQSLRNEIEQIDVFQLRTHATSYSKEFGLYFSIQSFFYLKSPFFLVENMQKYTTDLMDGNNLRADRNRYTLRHYFSEESSASVCYLLLQLFVIFLIDVVACRLSDMLVFYICLYFSTNNFEKKKVRVLLFLLFFICFKVICSFLFTFVMNKY
jgi:hypothetical protein